MARKTQSSRDDHVKSDISAIESELLWLSDSTGKRLLANKVVNSLIGWLRLKDTPFSALFIALVIGCLLLAAKVMASTFIFHTGSRYILGSILASFLIAFSFAAIKILHDIILPANARKMILLIEPKGFSLLRSWFMSFLSLRKQLFFSSLIGILAAVTIYLVELYTTAQFDAGDYILGTLAMFCVSHGGYCGLLIPTIAKPLAYGGMKLFWLNPSDSEPIKIASWGFRLLTLADGFFVTVCMFALYWFRPWESPLVAILSAGWLVVGVIAVSYSFYYPHYYLNIAIKREKKRQLESIKKFLDEYYLRLPELQDEEFKKLNEYIGLYERLSKTRETSIGTSALRSYVTSVIVPTISFVTGLIDFQPILQSIFVR